MGRIDAKAIIMGKEMEKGRFERYCWIQIDIKLEI